MKRTTRQHVTLADARDLPIADDSVDIVITSPPYLNAIDYIRGHKFSLIWMGHSIDSLREVRATNVGTETQSVANRLVDDPATDHILSLMCPLSGLSKRQIRMLRQYVNDMRTVLSETKRVLRKGGKAILVVGNCNLRETFIQNSEGIIAISKQLGMIVSKTRSRPLPENRRYLPPPGSSSAGTALKKRLREEVVITLVKP